MQCLVVHPAEHEYLTRVVLLDDGGHQAVGVAFEAGGQGGIETGHGHILAEPVRRDDRGGGGTLADMTVDDQPRDGTTRRAVVLLAAAATTVYAALASTTGVNTVGAAVAVAVPGAAVAIVALRRQNKAVLAGPGLRRGATIWAVVALTALLWEAGAYLGELTVGQYEHPTLSVLLAPLMHDQVVRFAAWSLWLYAGWRLILR